MIHDEPKLISSIKSQRIVVDGYSFAIEIHRLDNDRAWTPEFVDHQGTSHVWEEQFKTDRDARNAAIQALERESTLAFMHGNNVFPFRQGGRRM